MEQEEKRGPRPEQVSPEGPVLHDREIELHNLYGTKGWYDKDATLPMKLKVLISFIPVLNLAVAPLHVSPEADAIRGLLQTLMIVNSFAIGRMFLREKLEDVAPAIAEDFMWQLSSFSKAAINAFCLNIFLLAVVVLANPHRGRRRAIEVWDCVRWGIVVLLGLELMQFVCLCMLYETWGVIVYNTTRLSVFWGAGTWAFVLIVIASVIACIGIPGEVALHQATQHRLALRKAGAKSCPFISSLETMPATQTTMALCGLTYQRLQVHKHDRMLLLKILKAAGLPSSDCVDVINALQAFIPPGGQALHRLAA